MCTSTTATSTSLSTDSRSSLQKIPTSKMWISRKPINASFWLEESTILLSKRINSKNTRKGWKIQSRKTRSRSRRRRMNVSSEKPCREWMPPKKLNRFTAISLRNIVNGSVWWPSTNAKKSVKYRILLPLARPNSCFGRKLKMIKGCKLTNSSKRMISKSWR